MANILLVDDVAAVRKALSMVLESAGHKVTEAADGMFAKDILLHRSFDLVITDIMMPNMDGFEFIAFIRNMPGIRPIILAISGGGAALPADQALLLAKTKADAVLAKPFENAKLLDMVSALLSGGR